MVLFLGVFSLEVLLATIVRWFLLLYSLFINVDHAEGSSLIAFSFVFYSEDHHFVPREAVALFFGHLEYERNELLHVLLCVERRKMRS